MSKDLQTVDVDWAWSQFEPNDAKPWNRSLAAHLYRRAGYAASSAQLDEAVSAGLTETVRSLIEGAAESPEFQEEMTDLASAIIATGKTDGLPSWWLYRMLQTPNQLLDKTTLFWHGHFATSAAKVEDPKMMLDQNALLREHALGRFDALLHAVSRDPAMLIYLDSASNRKGHPNENYARELMELFSLGVGHYSEKDVQEVARCFTGWEIHRGRFRFFKPQHDAGMKRILGDEGKFGGEDAVRIVLEQPAAPMFIARKIIRFFVTDAEIVPEQLIEPLAAQLRTSEFTISSVIGQILTSNLFYSPLAIGRKIRSPVELTVGLMRALEGSTNVYRLSDDLAELGQKVFFPPSVKGWDGGRTWINSSTLLARANVVRRLMHDDKSRFAGGDLATVLEKQGIEEPLATVDWLAELLVAAPLPQEVRQNLCELVPTGSQDRSAKLADLVSTIGALPEFQLG